MFVLYILHHALYILHSSPTRPTKRRLVCRKACSSQRFYVRLIQTIKPSPSTQYINVIHYVSCHRHYKIYSVYYTVIQARFDLTQTRANSTLPPHWNVASQCGSNSTFSSGVDRTDFKLMVAQQSGKGPNLKVVKWW